ncbi:MAG: FHA domain-containing protein [Chloroflexota bacterium]
MQKGPTPGQTFPINAILITLGRDPLADIVVSDPEVSRQHARLMETESGYELQDLGSTNGTFIDGSRLGGEAQLLQNGQTVEMGSGVVFLFQEVPMGDGEPTFIDQMDEMLPDELLPPPLPEQPDPTSIDQQSYQTPTPFPPPAEQPSYQTPTPFPEEPKEAVDWTDISPAAPSEPPPTIVPPIAETAPYNNSSPSNRTTIWKIIGLLLILFVSCCAFTLFMWFIGGDWLLTQFGLLP